MTSYDCKECGKNSIIRVATADGIQLYSCHTESCKWHAQLLAMMDEGMFVYYHDLLKTTIEMAKEHEQDYIQKG